MRFFALDTDLSKIRKRYQLEGEHELLFTRYHWLRFAFRTFRSFFNISVGFVLVGFWWYFGWPLVEVVGVIVMLWTILVFLHILGVYVDWRYDFFLVTTDKIVFVDQTTFFRHEEKPIHLESVGGASSTTQFWGIFPFGRIELHLKEALGGESIDISYVPHAEQVASLIAEAVSRFQRSNRKDRGYVEHSTPLQS